MKKTLILVIALLVIPLVEALTLFGEEISMLVLIPSILILLVLFVFIFMIIKDKLKNKAALPNIELSNTSLPPPPESLIQDVPAIEEMPLGEPAKELPKEEQQKSKKDYLQELNELKEKLPSISTKDAHEQLTDLIKRFFADYANINYHFTFEELEKELKQKHKKIVCFADNFSSINYSPEGISQGNLNELITEFKDIIKFIEEEAHPLTPQFKKELEEKKKKINHLLKKGEKSIGKDTNKSIEDYNKIFYIYKTLTDKEKASIRQPIMDFYNRLR